MQLKPFTQVFAKHVNILKPVFKRFLPEHQESIGCTITADVQKSLKCSIVHCHTNSLSLPHQTHSLYMVPQRKIIFST